MNLGHLKFGAEAVVAIKADSSVAECGTQILHMAVLFSLVSLCEMLNHLVRHQTHTLE
jgi:hypothetical protein